MSSEHAPAGYRKLYATLLRFYPKPYRERFGRGMEQTFNDLCLERTGTGDGLFTFALWAFGDTFVGMIRENISSTFSSLAMHRNNIMRLAFITALLLLIPVLGNRFVNGWNWTLFDFVFAGTIIFGTGVAYELIAKRSRNTAYRCAVGLALAGAFLLVWINGAVGIIGDDNPANLMYVGVLAIGFFGSILAFFQPRGMMRTMFAVALAQMVVPMIALMVWRTNFSPGVLGVFLLNAIFAAFWVGSGLLFRRAVSMQPPAVAPPKA